MKLRAIAARLTVPWSGFVVAFLYYAGVTAALLGGVSPDGPVVAGVYLAPLMAYVAAIAVRLSAALAALVSSARPPLRLASAMRGA